MGVGMWWRDSTHQLIRAVLVTLLGTVPVQAQSQALDGRPQSVEPSETQGDGQPHLARWADGETHGAVFLQVAGVLDLAAPTPESSGFAVLVRGSDDGFLVLQAVGGVQRDPLVIRNGEWTPATDADRAWIGGDGAPDGTEARRFGAASLDSWGGPCSGAGGRAGFTLVRLLQVRISGPVDGLGTGHCAGRLVGRRM